MRLNWIMVALLLVVSGCAGRQSFVATPQTPLSPSCTVEVTSNGFREVCCWEDEDAGVVRCVQQR